MKTKKQLTSESIESFLLRGGEITYCKPKHASTSRKSQGKPTRDQMLSVIRNAPPQTTSAANVVKMASRNASTAVQLILSDERFDLAA